MRKKYTVMALVLSLVALAGVGVLLWSALTASTPAAAPQPCRQPDEVDIYLHNDTDLPHVQADPAVPATGGDPPAHLQ